MIKKLFGALLLMLSMTVYAQRTGTMVIDNGECKYDTVEYKQIGPGTTYMKFQFPEIKNNGNYGKKVAYKMIMYVLKVDLTNPYVKIAPYLSKGEYYAIHPQDWEVERQKDMHLKPIASAMGNAFWASTDQSIARTSYEVYNSLVSDNKVFYDEGTDYPKFSIDENRIARVTRTKLKAYATAGQAQLQIGQINHHRDIADNKGQYSLFCNGLPKSVAVNNNIGVDVRVKVNTNNGNILVGADNKCTVLAIENGCGHQLGEGEAILSGINDCEAALRALKVGDEVSISMVYDGDDVKDVNVSAQVTSFSHATGQSYALLNGQVKYTATQNYAITAYGCSQDGKTAYISALQISEGTSDAPCNYMSEALANLGAWNAIWMDGGPSSEITVGGDYVTTCNLGAQYNGREIPSGVMILSTAPTDNNISSIKVLDTSAQQLMVGESFTPSVYGYNANGEVVDYNAQYSSQVSITCDPAIGTVSNGSFTATAAGTGNITISMVGSTEIFTIPVTVKAARSFTLSPKKIFTGEGRTCQIKAYVGTNGETVELNSSNITWTTNAPMVIKSCDNGLVTPLFDGVADVTAQYEDLSDVVEVTVENLAEEGTKELNFKSDVEGRTTINKHLPSVPTSFSIEVQSAPNSTVTIHYTTGDEHKTVTCNIPESGKAIVNVPLDYDSDTTYPVSVNYIDGNSTANLEGYPTPYIITNLAAGYHNYVPGSVVGITAVIANGDNAPATYNTMGMKVTPTYRGVVVKDGKKYVTE